MLCRSTTATAATTPAATATTSLAAFAAITPTTPDAMSAASAAAMPTASAAMSAAAADLGKLRRYQCGRRKSTIFFDHCSVWFSLWVCCSDIRGEEEFGFLMCNFLSILLITILKVN